ncbi:MAG: cytochrome c [Burkholderiales bacterium]|nr:cytochrome c [Burkholderiales bacterium]
MQQRTQACVSCHGNEGKASAEGFYPRIAGKPEAYLFNQLIHFREGQRSHATMNYLVENLSDAYLLEIARYFSNLHPPYASPVKAQVSEKVFKRGEQLALKGDEKKDIPACVSCHGNSLTGLSPVMPGLIGLPRDYLNAQLGAWLNGQRKAAAPDCMADIVKAMSSEDLNAVTAFLSSQPVPLNARPAAQGNIKFPKQCGTHLKVNVAEASIKQAAPEPVLSAQEQRGWYVAKLGNCEGCHTQRGGQAFAGGRAVETPFGKVFAGNLTPDVKTGLGAWSADDFYRAMHEGKSRDGHYLYPAFPFTNYTQMSRGDVDDLFAYLRRLPAVENATPAAQMDFPFNLRPLMAVWRALYFKPAATVAIAPQASLQRGAYLVNGPGHCNACHTPRNRLGALQKEADLAGATIPVLNWYAPALNSDAIHGLGRYPEHQLVEVLKTGRSENNAVYGPMADVVKHSLQHYKEQDLKAMAAYLKSLPPLVAAVSPVSLVSKAAEEAVFKHGAKLYEQHCKDCHGDQGQGRAFVYPGLAGNVSVVAPTPVNPLKMVLNGGFGPSTPQHPFPYGMPPYRVSLSSEETAAVVSFIRNAWGNKAGYVSPVDVDKYRTVP